MTLPKKLKNGWNLKKTTSRCQIDLAGSGGMIILIYIWKSLAGIKFCEMQICETKYSSTSWELCRLQMGVQEYADKKNND